MERNLRLYPAYQATRSANFAMPVFFLYFLSVLSPEEAILLGAIYYASVVVLEVPSGQLSDRVGRRLTLLLAGASGAASAALFATTASFAPFALAQVLKAASIAFNSGTDTSLLYDSLAARGRGPEIGDREGRAYAAGLGAASLAAAAGGLAGGADLRAAYGLTGLAQLAAFAIAWRMREPPREAGAGAGDPPARRVLASLRDPVLRWVFVFVVAMTVLNHVPYEFFQPYLELLMRERELGGYALTPALAGGVAAGMLLLGALASRRAMAVRARLGVLRSLIGTMGLQLAIIGSMGALLSPLVAALIALRSVPMGILTPIVLAEIHPRVATSVRATYLSLQSLAGRLAFSACLAAASWAVSGRALTHGVLASVLLAFAVAGLAVLLLLVLRPPLRS